MHDAPNTMWNMGSTIGKHGKANEESDNVTKTGCCPQWTRENIFFDTRGFLMNLLRPCAIFLLHGKKTLESAFTLG